MAERDIRMNLQILFEEYRMLSGEILLYLKETIKCFIFGAILAGVYLGLGISAAEENSGILTQIQQYVPYGFLMLIIYFLILAYIRIGISTRRGIIEKRINRLVSAELMGFDEFERNIQSMGFLRVGRPWYAKVPTPMPIFGILVFIGALLIFTADKMTYKSWIFRDSLIICGLIAIYVFFIYPALARRAHEKDFYNTAH